MKTLISPSILAADFGNLNAAIAMVNQSEADWFHVDVMDGVFVPNISFGFPIMEALQRKAEKPLDVHLMIVNPEKYIETFAKLGAAVITVHYEACPHLHRTVQQIKDAGCKAGVALNPHTAVQGLENVIADLDLVLIMSVNPGFGGQKFIPNALQKIEQVRNLAQAKNPNLMIEVDGGINLENHTQVMAAGADVLVAGSAIFNTESPMVTIQKFKNKITN